MHSSPITSWEGAAAYFTFADKPFVVGFVFTLSVIVTLVVIGAMILHEKHSFERLNKGE
jgi:hypothetical protein